MTIYTMESCQNTNQKDLIPITFLLQNKIEETNNSVLVEMSKLNEYFSTLEANFLWQTRLILYYQVGLLV